jgi:putative FmdB family regulatory protein
MPIYEYRCNECGHKLESLQKLADAPLVTCPACGRNALSKLVSVAGFQLKGSGWYATDFKGSGSKPAEKTGSESGSESKSSDAAATTSPAKSETASEAKAAPAPAATTPATGSGSSSA